MYFPIDFSVLSLIYKKIWILALDRRYIDRPRIFLPPLGARRETEKRLLETSILLEYVIQMSRKVEKIELRKLKLKGPFLCTTPFNAVMLKRQRKSKQIPFERYPHIPLLTSNAKLRRMLLGKRLMWTIKEDGENVTIWKNGKKIMISSRNQESASQNITAVVKRTPEYPKILELIEENPTFRCIVEECREGRLFQYWQDYMERMVKKQKT